MPRIKTTTSRAGSRSTASVDIPSIIWAKAEVYGESYGMDGAKVLTEALEVWMRWRKVKTQEDTWRRDDEAAARRGEPTGLRSDYGLPPSPGFR